MLIVKIFSFQAKGMDTGVDNSELEGVPVEYSSDEEEEPISDSHDEVLEASRRIQKERPVTCANMDDIKHRFESGRHEAREERREEQKKELQSIRSRLFMGKQAKLKEQYQQAVADSEQKIGNNKDRIDVDLDLEKTRSIKEKFEKGIFDSDQKEDDGKPKVSEEELAVFEYGKNSTFFFYVLNDLTQFSFIGISKQSRNIFKELDANISKQPQSLPPLLSPVASKTSEKRRQYEVCGSFIVNYILRCFCF